jgi:phosphoadenosine phosphosulfate reductase
MPPVHSSIAHPSPAIAAKSAGATEAAMATPDFVSRRTAALNTLLHDASPEEILAAACDTVGAGRLAVVSSFGAESAVMLAAAAAVDPALPVLLIDTGYLFPETLAYRDMLQERLGLRDIRAIGPNGEELAAEDAEGDLYARDPDACCALRKVRPLAKALAGFAGWANGRKRFQGAARTAIPIAEADGARLKVNPLALLSPEEIAARFRALDLPPHPLEAFGFRSIGCMPCTTATRPGEDPRAGRWRGRGKVECGIHTGLTAKA